MDDQEFAFPDCPIVNDVDFNSTPNSGWTMQPAGLKNCVFHESRKQYLNGLLGMVLKDQCYDPRTRSRLELNTRSSMNRSERFYQIDQLLSVQKVMSRQDLLDALEVSWATLKRDLSYLRDRFNAP